MKTHEDLENEIMRLTKELKVHFTMNNTINRISFSKMANLRQQFTDLEISDYVKARYETKHIDINDDILLAWGKDDRICFSPWNDVQIMEDMSRERRERNLKMIIEL
ncbi:MAG: hypothetical protein EOO43_08375 [Flavobacterium sp.]|nr:MAG: hypothetical protein EOO43_08375 [Flavobacterium sp.]